MEKSIIPYIKIQTLNLIKMEPTEDKKKVRSKAALAMSLFGSYFNIVPDKENEQETIENISAGVRFRGANLWVLIFAILIASLGLNVNSTADRKSVV